MPEETLEIYDFGATNQSCKNAMHFLRIKNQRFFNDLLVKFPRPQKPLVFVGSKNL